jgi:hypothetical protein
LRASRSITSTGCRKRLAIVEDAHMGVRVKLDQDVYVAIRAVVAASHRAE